LLLLLLLLLLLCWLLLLLLLLWLWLVVARLVRTLTLNRPLLRLFVLITLLCALQSVVNTYGASVHIHLLTLY
jgi:hypothetical protein